MPTASADSRRGAERAGLNRFGSDTEREFELIKKHLGEQGVEAIVCEHFAKGSKGATELAKSMVKLIDTKPGSLKFVYDDADGNIVGLA